MIATQMITITAVVALVCFAAALFESRSKQPGLRETSHETLHADLYKDDIQIPPGISVNNLFLGLDQIR